MLGHSGIGRHRLHQVEDTFERNIAGEDPHHVVTMFRRGYSARLDLSMMGVLSGIEIAIWDTLGKAQYLSSCSVADSTTSCVPVPSLPGTPVGGR